MENKTIMNKNKKVIILLLLFLLVIGGYGIYKYVLYKPQEKVSIISGDFLPQGKDAQKMSDKDISEAAQKKVDASQFNMIIGSKVKVDSQTNRGKLSIKNPKKNAYPVNVVITDDKSNNVIYTSGAIEPGEEVVDVKLEKTLDKGSHQATARFSLYDSKTKAKKGEVAAGIDIIVN